MFQDLSWKVIDGHFKILPNNQTNTCHLSPKLLADWFCSPFKSCADFAPEIIRSLFLVVERLKMTRQFLSGIFYWCQYFALRTPDFGWRPGKNHIHCGLWSYWPYGHSVCHHQHHTRTPYFGKWSYPYRLPNAAYSGCNWPVDCKQKWKWRKVWGNWVVIFACFDNVNRNM